MERTDPPSPAPSQNHGLEQLAAYNSTMPYQGGSIDRNSPYISQPQSRYSSPAPQQQLMYDHGTPVTHASPYVQQPGYGVSPYPTDGLLDPNHYQGTYNTPATSPHTPLSSGKIPRSRTTTKKNGVTKSTVKKANGKKKKKGGSKDEQNTLSDPLTVLCKKLGLDDSMDINIDDFVKRPIEERRKEVEPKTGRIKRPMNAFMLYRKAFQHRVKKIRNHENHQVVSSVCGAGWAMESDKVKEHYNNLAKIESENHRAANPGYKFSPAKSKQKKESGGHSDDDGSDLEDAILGFDNDLYGPGRHAVPNGVPYGTRTMGPRGVSEDFDGMPHGRYKQPPPYNYPSGPSRGMIRMNPSHWDRNNPSKRAPMAYDQNLMYHQRVIERPQYTPQHYMGHYTIPHNQAMIQDQYYSHPQPQIQTPTPIIHPSSYHSTPVNENGDENGYKYNMFPIPLQPQPHHRQTQQQPPPPPPEESHELKYNYDSNYGVDNFGNPLNVIPLNDGHGQEGFQQHFNDQAADVDGHYFDQVNDFNTPEPLSHEPSKLALDTVLDPQLSNNDEWAVTGLEPEDDDNVDKFDEVLGTTSTPEVDRQS